MYSDNAMLMWHFSLDNPGSRSGDPIGQRWNGPCYLLLDLQASLKCVEETEQAATVCVEGL